MGFISLRISGSHNILKHSDGRMTTIPMHGNEDISRGLLHKIIREDLNISIEEFLSYRKK